VPELTARQIIEGMPGRFRPERAGRADAVVQFNLTGDHCGGAVTATLSITITEPARFHLPLVLRAY